MYSTIIKRSSVCLAGSLPLWQYNTCLYRNERELTGQTARRGRTRDARIDARVLAAASRHLAASGYEAMSVAAVAQEAGTTRQALYRGWPTKASLAAAALQQTADDGDAVRSDNPYANLVAELSDFQRG